MSLSTIGSGDVSSRVEAAIQRRGAAGNSLSTAWTALGAAGGALAVVALFITWYSNGTIDVSGSAAGWLSTIGLVLVVGGALVLVAKQLRLAGAGRVNADLFTYSVFAGVILVVLSRQLVFGDLDTGIYLLFFPLVGLVAAIVGVLRGTPVLAAGSQRTTALIAVAFVIRIVVHLVQGNATGAATWLIAMALLGLVVGLGRARPGAATLEMEQVALVLASLGGLLVILKRAIDSDFATSGWVWGLVAALAVTAASLAACQYLGILTMFQVMLFAALGVSTLIMVVLLVQVVGDGWPVLSTRLNEFWSGTLRSQADSERLGLSQGVIGSLWIAAFVVFLSFPIGIAAAVYLEEYAPRNRFTNMLDIIVRNLAGVPSVVYGLLGVFLFVQSGAIISFFARILNGIFEPIHNALHRASVSRGWESFFASPYDEITVDAGQSTLLAGGVTLAILVLPIIVITAAEAVRAVPQSLREGAYGVGATKWEVIRGQVLPFAAPGILTGTLLALARAFGEAAPLLLVGAVVGRLSPRGSTFDGFDAFFGQFFDRFTALPMVIVGWVFESGRDPGFGPAAGAAIVVLLVFVMLMNSVAVFLRNYFEQKRA